MGLPERSDPIGPCRGFTAKLAEAHGLSPSDVLELRSRITGAGEVVLSFDVVPNGRALAILTGGGVGAAPGEAPTDV